MKKLLFVTLLFTCFSGFSQTASVRIGYIDMEYILEKAPDYAEAKNQLEQKASKWKEDIEARKNEINKLKESLASEKVLLTKELIEEREEEIAFQEKDLFDYQEKRFGARGDLIIQKSILVKPIQDQVFTAIQDIAEQKNYDFILDKSSDLTILFANKRHDISDQVVRVIMRAEKREQLTKKQQKAQDAKEAIEDLQDENPALAERQKVLDEKKAAREKLLEERKAAREKLIEDRKKAAQEKRQKVIDEKEAEKSGTVIEKDTTEDKTEESKTGEKVETPKTTTTTASTAEERRKAIEEKRKKIIAEREAAKKAKLEEQRKKENKKENEGE
ncbi:OmpH family outer membrane protein [Flavobacterium sediminilitoris]|uniref:OmpH family outer membrane protein n=1 Tax=Flavobacterium sediminilitoris TaxID=2024526 RepID=A0ABY4HRB3_9FLAO|nr:MULTISPECIES: OmpH family outer membrane protein [Flavobacterium]UOX35429.1 OmpH family outer membrane protein [Flavobacterium sediminilitoris]